MLTIAYFSRVPHVRTFYERLTRPKYNDRILVLILLPSFVRQAPL